MAVSSEQFYQTLRKELGAVRESLAALCRSMGENADTVQDDPLLAPLFMRGGAESVCQASSWCLAGTVWLDDLLKNYDKLKGMDVDGLEEWKKEWAAEIMRRAEAEQ